MALLLETVYTLMLMLAVVAVIFAAVICCLGTGDYDLEEVVNG